MRVQRRGARRRQAGIGHVAVVLAVVVAMIVGTVGTTLFATVTSQPQQAAAAKKTEKADKDAKKADKSKKSRTKPDKAKKKPATEPAEADKGGKKDRKSRNSADAPSDATSLTAKDATGTTAEAAAGSAPKREPVFKKSTKGARTATAASTGGLTTTRNSADLASMLGGADIEVSNVTTAGAEAAMGLFETEGSTAPSGIIGFNSGIMLSSGDIANVVGPNSSGGISGSNGSDGDVDLNPLARDLTQDAAVLEFDFVPVGSVVSFRYIFASEEYNEFVDAGFNDVFGFFVNGKNCATVGGQPVSVDTINLIRNAGSFRDNEGGTYNTEMDGLTRVLTCTASVTPNALNHAKLAIADVGDDVYDSVVFLEADSFVNCQGDTSLYDYDGNGIGLPCDREEAERIPRIYVVNGVTTDNQGDDGWSSDGYLSTMVDNLIAWGYPRTEVRNTVRVYDDPYDLDGFGPKKLRVLAQLVGDIFDVLDETNWWNGGAYSSCDFEGDAARFSVRTCKDILKDLEEHPLAPGQEILLIGHSGGGAIVANVSRMLTGQQQERTNGDSAGIQVRGVVSMGSPSVNWTKVMDGTKKLALQHVYDRVGDPGGSWGLKIGKKSCLLQLSLVCRGIDADVEVPLPGWVGSPHKKATVGRSSDSKNPITAHRSYYQSSANGQQAARIIAYHMFPDAPGWTLGTEEGVDFTTKMVMPRTAEAATMGQALDAGEETPSEEPQQAPPSEEPQQEPDRETNGNEQDAAAVTEPEQDKDASDNESNGSAEATEPGASGNGTATDPAASDKESKGSKEQSKAGKAKAKDKASKDQDNKDSKRDTKAKGGKDRQQGARGRSAESTQRAGALRGRDQERSAKN
jgi:hypothetical protein